MLEDKISTSQQINTLSNTDDNAALILINHYKLIKLVNVNYI